MIYTIELCTLGKFVHGHVIWLKFESYKKKISYEIKSSDQNHTQQNCTLFSYHQCKYEQISFQTFRIIHYQIVKCIFFFTPCTFICVFG